MSEGLSVEATGETVGEAKWAALRELERMNPGLDKGAVEFQVVAEGERGLLGVGYTPARVVATVPEDGAAGPADEPPPDEASSPPSCASWSRTSRPEWAFSAAWTSTSARTPSWLPVPGAIWAS